MRSEATARIPRPSGKVCEPACTTSNRLSWRSSRAERIEGVIEREATARGVSSDEIRDIYLRQTSMRSFASADEVADTVLFLASDNASRISGQAISVDGHTEGFLNWLDQ